MEIGGDFTEVKDPQVVRKDGVQGSNKVVHPEPGRDLEVCDLAFGVDAGVGPARAMDGDQLPRDLEQSVFHGALDCPLPGWRCQPLKSVPS